MSSEFSHVDERRQPAMVDVGGKAVTHRTAVAEARVRFPPAVAEALRESGFETSKGPVFQTAIIAGTMAAKRTHELIPFCHPLAIENCRLEIEMDGRNDAVVRCAVSVHHKTGVEMEALTGASVAALTIYDMCKALSHEIVVTDVRLIEKHGGRRDVMRT
jgi:cyclic pyranopterin monophosphate synthase